MTRLVLLVTVLLGACVRPPGPIAGDFTPTSIADAQREQRSGERIRWGGTIVSTTPGKAATCLEIVSLPLDARARPRRTDDTLGRFIACAPGFYDPEVFAPRREVTVVGALEPTESGKVGDYDYLFPRVAAEAIWLWPERNPEDRVCYGGAAIGGPYWYPFWWGWYGPGPHLHHH